MCWICKLYSDSNIKYVERCTIFELSKERWDKKQNKTWIKIMIAIILLPIISIFWRKNWSRDFEKIITYIFICILTLDPLMDFLRNFLLVITFAPRFSEKKVG